MKDFNAKEQKDLCVKWISDWFNKNGDGCNAIIGISGGKDSTVVAGLCVEALGCNRVVGVLMPNGVQSDIKDAERVVECLGITSFEVNIGDTINSIISNMPKDIIITKQTYINLPPRIRMSTLYAISQSLNGRVANTCNLSEDYVGYSTRYGDSVGDFSPLSNFTATEVRLIGRELNLPIDLIDKTPSDGLCGKTDEDNLGFSYEVLDKYILYGEIDDKNIKDKIDKMHDKNKFKMLPMQTFVR